MAEEKIDKEVFDTFFRENYVEPEYTNVKNEFEEIAGRGLAELFSDEANLDRITAKNFIVYLRSDVYAEFEAIVEEVFDSLNSEIEDAMIDVSSTMEHEDEITETYWDTCGKLLKRFLGQLYADKIDQMVREYQNADEL